MKRYDRLVRYAYIISEHTTDLSGDYLHYIAAHCPEGTREEIRTWIRYNVVSYGTHVKRIDEYIDVLEEHLTRIDELDQMVEELTN